ncbi:MAG: hypothetical protein H0W78_03395 [Planctomycetes bacterium]|nr:hypothetical protein [Planctomycetota bacterium]
MDILLTNIWRFAAWAVVLALLVSAPVSAADNFLVTTTTQQTAGAPFTITVTARTGTTTDAAYVGTISVSSSDVQAVLPTNYTFVAGDNGIRQFTAVELRTAGVQTITATDVGTPAITGISDGITVNPAAASQLVVSGFADPTVAGVPHDVTVTARDAFGNTATGYTGTVAITSSDTAAVLPSAATLTAGTGNFSVQLRTAPGPWAIIATDIVTSTVIGTQSGIDVTPAAANRLAITQMPTSAIADTVLSPQPVIHIQDAFGNLVDDDTTTVTAALTTGTPGQFKGTKTVTASNGVATFTNLKHDRAENIVIAFSSTPSLTGVSSPTIGVGSGVASTLQVSGFPSSQSAGTPTSVIVTALDGVGNTATGYTGTVHFTSNDPQAILPADYTFLVSDNGVKTFTTAAQLRTVGTRSVTATDTGTASITGTQGSITVTPATAIQLGFTTQPGSATAGAAFATQPVVRTRDAYGNNSTVGLAANVPVSMTLSFGAGSLAGTTSINVGTSGTPGIATFSTLRIDNASGTKVVTASATLDGSPASIASSLFTVAPDVAFRLGIQTQPPVSVTAGATFSPAPVITILDQFNNLRSGDTVTVSAARSGGTGTLQGTTAVNAVAGVATFSALSHSVANDITIQFTSGLLLPVTSSTVTVNAGSATALKITGNATQVAGTANAITITAIDSLGNAVSGYAGLVSLLFGGGNPSTNPVTAPTVENSSATPIVIGSATALTFINGVATTNLRLYRIESTTITVSDGTLSASGANDLDVSVTAASATRLVITGPPTLTAGAVGNLTITATDVYGNTDATYINTHALTFSGAGSSTNPVTAPTVENNVGTQVAFGGSTSLVFTAGVTVVNGIPGNGRMRLHQVGSALIAASDGAIAAAGSDRLSVSVTHAAANKLVVGGSASQTAGQTQNITVTIQDQYGNTATSQGGPMGVTFAISDIGGGFNQSDNRPRVSRHTSGMEIDFGNLTSLQFLNGVASVVNDAPQCRMRLVKAGTHSVTATASGLFASTPLSVTVNAGAASRLGIASVGTLTPTVGEATTVTVVLRDDGGNTVTGSTAIDLTLSASPTAGSLRGGYGGAQIAAGASGTTITGVILERAENTVLQVDDSPALYVAGSSQTIVVQNDQPVLAIASGTLTYAGGSGAIPFGTPGIAVSDSNSSGFSPFYSGAIITVSITAGGVPTEDLLQVRSAGAINVSGTTVKWNNTPIATTAGGVAGNSLVVTINGVDVPEAGVMALLENLCFHNIGGANPAVGVRTVSVGFNDGSSTAPGGARAATAVTRTVQVVVGNALPVIEANVELSVARSSTTVISNTTLRVTDEESVAGAVVFTVVNFPSEGDLLLGGNVPLSAGGVETFTQADVDAGSLSYQHQGSSLPGDVFTFIVSDGTNQLPVTTFSITVPGADANPVLFLPLTTLTYSEGAVPSVLFPAAPFASGTLVSDANTFEYSNGSLLIEIVDASGTADPHAGDRLSVRSQSIPALPQYDQFGPYNFTPEMDYTGHIALVGTDVVRRQYPFNYYWLNDYYNYYYPGMFPNPGGLPFPSPSPPTVYPNSWYSFYYPVPIDVRIARQDTIQAGVGGPLRFSLLSGVGAAFGDPIVSAQAVAQLIDNLTFTNVSEDPPERDRWLRITLAEGAPSTAVGVASIKLKITPSNDAPVFEIPAPPPAPVEVIDALAGVTLRVRVLANDPDLPSASLLTYSLIMVDPASSGVATINSTSGALDFTPLATFADDVILSVRATDNLGAFTDAAVEVNVVAGPTTLGPLVVSDPPFESFAGEALSYPLVIRPDPSLPAPGAGTVSVTLVGDVPFGAVLTPTPMNELGPVLTVPALVRPPDGVYTFGIRVEINYGGPTGEVGYQPVTLKVRASGAPN